MKRNSEEQKIRQFFRDARQRDEQHAPGFAEMLAATRSNTRHAGWRWNAWQIAFAALALIAIGIAAFIVFKQPKAQPANQTAFAPAIMPLPDYPPSVVELPADSVVIPVIKAPRINSKPSPRRLPVVQPQFDAGQMALLNFKWQSPTAFLLRTPGDDLLKSVPRVGDSIIRFDVIHPDEKN